MSIRKIREISERFAQHRWAVPLLAILAGVCAGVTTPSGGLPAAAIWVYTPLFLALDLLCRRTTTPSPLRCPRLWGKSLGVCLVLGLLQAAWNGSWLVNTVHVFGGLPLPLAHGVNLLGYGSLFGVEAFVFLALPFVWGWRHRGWGLVLVVCWATTAQAYAPRFFAWSYGMLLYGAEKVVQVVDVVGSEGLNILLLGLNLLLFALLRELYAPGSTKKKALLGGGCALALLFASAHGYGIWRMERLRLAAEAGPTVNLVGIQPSFSLRQLASNPTLTHSDRVRSMQALITDTEQALQRLEPDPNAPTVVVWPESVYPGPYFHAPGLRRAVEDWVRQRGVHLVLSTITSQATQSELKPRQRVFGASLHISPQRGFEREYRKITLIPFGETIPLAGVFPAWRDFVKKRIPQISEFESGREFTLFSITPSLRIAPMICFDVIGTTVPRGMAREGAELALVLANLSWFGRTNIFRMFEVFGRFRAMESRIPYLLLSQNGRSMLIDARGRIASRILAPFTVDALALQVRIPRSGSFFTRHQQALRMVYTLSLLGVLGVLGARHLRRKQKAYGARLCSKGGNRAKERGSRSS